MNEKLKVIIISDGTGETATALCRAAMIQFKSKDVYFTRYKNIRKRTQIDSIFTEAAIHHDLIVYTIVQYDLREHIADLSRTKHVRSLDLLGPTLTAFSNYFDQEPSQLPGLLHEVNDEYFKRVAAMEFTINHDDGRNIDSLHLADVVLLGISRTSKTPLSIYLAHKGLKIVNIPIISHQDLPEGLFKIDQRKIFALTIDSDALTEIRQKRLGRLGAQSHTGNYADQLKVTEEVLWADSIFESNKRWPVFNVTNKALEETAAEILKLINMRKNNIFKQSKN